MLSPQPRAFAPLITCVHIASASATLSPTSLLGLLLQTGREGGVWPEPPAWPALLPRGRFSVVRQCQEKASGRVLAAKIVPYHAADRAAVLREYEALKGLRHPHLAQLQAAYLSPRHLVLILELCFGPELFPCLAER